MAKLIANNLTANETIISYWPFLPNVSPLAGMRISIGVVSFGLNIALLTLHTIKPAYVTHFTIYLLFLYITNTIYLLGASPFIFLSEVYKMDIGYYGMSACMFFNYFQRVVSIVPVMCHTLIALNRFWALQYPIHYRERHTKKVAVLICLAMILYTHLMKMPSYIIYTPSRFQSTAASPKCEDPVVDSWVHWARTDICINRLAPLLLIVGLYIYLIYRRYQRKHRRIGSTPNRGLKPRSQTTEDALPGDRYRSPPNQGGTVHRSVVRPFVVLTLTTVGVIVCWLPLDIVFVLHWFADVRASGTVFTACHMLYTLQILFDPLMWIVSLRKTSRR